jgi:RNA polymerase sigma-70 factor (ECF subfamily)
VRQPWREYLDALAPLRPSLPRYCLRLTGSVWDAEDLVQDTLLRVFGLLGKVSADLENPRAYLARTATHLWIDRIRRSAREREILDAERDALAAGAGGDPSGGLAVRDAANALLAELAPRELVDRFLAALAAKDLATLEAICSADVAIELVGGAEFDSFAAGRMFFEHAHFVLPELGFGTNPNWKLGEWDGEPVVLGFRTLDGVEGLNEIHRLEESEGRITRVRCYCFCPDTLRTVAERLGIPALRRPYRSPG